ncbi:hypothetical protein [Streptomonospora sediminis]
MTDKVIRPDEVPVPPVDCDALDEAATALKNDGADVSQAGQDIKSTWHGLEGIYAAPESDSLFSAINPVATKGDDFGSAAASVADALSTFAEKVRPIKARLKALKADAEDFQDKIDGDDDWREDEDKTDELDTLNNDILAATHEYQQAERDCANTITALFGGTTFVATAPGEEGSVGADEQAHGYTEALKDVETPWATPQEHDAPWYEDVWDGVKDFGVGIAEDLGSMVGLYGEDGWGVGSAGEWWGNIKNNWGDTLNGLGSLVGLYGENGWGVGSFGEWWGNLSSGWTEFAHAIVPWREWGDRPGYVITQSVLNIGSMFVGGAGVYKGLAKGARKAGGGDADVDTSTNAPEQDLSPDVDALQRLGSRPGQGSTQDLQNTLDGLDIDGSQIDGLQNALSRAEGFGDGGAPAGGSAPEIDPAMHMHDGPELQPAGRHSLDIHANEEGPDFPPTTTPTPTEPVPDSPSPEPGQTPQEPGQAPPAPERPHGPPTGSGGEGGPGPGPGSGSGGPPTGGGGDGDRPQVPDGEAEGAGRDGGDQPDRREEPEPEETTGPDKSRIKTTPEGEQRPSETPEDGPTEKSERPEQPEQPERPAGQSPEEQQHGDEGKPQEQEQQQPDQEQPEQGRDQEQPDDPKGNEPDGEGKDNPESAQEPEPTDAIDQPQQDPADEKGDQDGQKSETDPDSAADDIANIATRPLPEDFAHGQVLEQLEESRVTRGDNGLIETIDGNPVNQYMRSTVSDRAHHMRHLVKQLEFTKAALGKTMGAVNSVAVDLRTGLVAEGINGRTSDWLRPTLLHKEIGDNLLAMEANGPYIVGDPERAGAIEHKHATRDEPTRHAEIKAVNRLLDARGAPAGTDALKEFRIDNLFTLRHEGPINAPCCGSCTRLLKDVSSPNSGKTYDPQGKKNPDIFYD